LLNDPAASVRLEATRLLLGITGLNPQQQTQLDKSIALYMQALMASADMPSGQVNLAGAYIAIGQYRKAEKAYLHALKLDSKSLAALLNLADLYRAQNREQLAIEQLLRAQSVYPDSAVAHHSLGLAQVRGQRPLKALANLQRAMQLAPDNSRYVYVYALALNSQGRGAEAITVLSRALNPVQPDRDMLIALVTINRDLGRHNQARDFADKLMVAFPTDSAVARLRNSLK
jgi:tetratricopeptide (TPR) repeat protein